MPRSWQNPSDANYKLLQGCGEPCGWWVYQALKFLPPSFVDDWKDKLAFYSTSGRDACRVSRTICQEREIILLSERIVPKTLAFTDPAARYFIFAVLHEVAHAVKMHNHPADAMDKRMQEKEADEIAFAWFNEHVQLEGKRDLRNLTMEEIEQARAKNQKLMKDTRGTK